MCNSRICFNLIKGSKKRSVDIRMNLTMEQKQVEYLFYCEHFTDRTLPTQEAQDPGV